MPDPTEPIHVLNFIEDGEQRSVPVDAITAEAFIAAAEGRVPLSARDRLDLADLAEDVPPISAFGVTTVLVPEPAPEPASWPEFADRLREGLEEARSDG